ncbi:MAG: tetratricopeptide repeat protein [Asgard group archaeon]|nr:tetratricopeptide repeat protein [Asgard group archaeon]
MASIISENSLEYGKLALEIKDFSTATKIFSNIIIEDNIKTSESWCSLAESLFYQAQFESALKCWHEAAALDPTNKMIWIKISAVYALMSQDELSIHYYKIAEDLPFDNE